MREAPEISIKHINKDKETEVPVSEIYLHNQATGKYVSGAILEAAIQVDNRYLLFMTDDVPFEEMLGIHLFDEQLNLLDSVTLGMMYSTGIFEQLKLHEPDSLSFHFIGDMNWHVMILAKPVFCIPFVSDPVGVKRKFGFKKHFKVYGEPLPEQTL